MEHKKKSRGWVLPVLKRPFAAWQEDRRCFDRNNENPGRCLSAHYFSAYRGRLALRIPGRSAASFGILLIGRGVRDERVVLHEFGHALQLQKMGMVRYFFQVAVFSVTANLLERRGRLPYDYYGSWWEKEADEYGGVDRRAAPWPEEACRRYADLLKWFFCRKK